MKMQLHTEKKTAFIKNCDHEEPHTQNACVTFTYHSPLILKIINVFKNTNINIGYRSSTAVFKQLKLHKTQ
jgi:hypothetical protein